MILSVRRRRASESYLIVVNNNAVTERTVLPLPSNNQLLNDRKLPLYFVDEAQVRLGQPNVSVIGQIFLFQYFDIIVRRPRIVLTKPPIWRYNFILEDNIRQIIYSYHASNLYTLNSLNSSGKSNNIFQCALQRWRWRWGCCVV